MPLGVEVAEQHAAVVHQVGYAVAVDVAEEPVRGGRGAHEVQLGRGGEDVRLDADGAGQRALGRDSRQVGELDRRVAELRLTPWSGQIGPVEHVVVLAEHLVRQVVAVHIGQRRQAIGLARAEPDLQPDGTLLGRQPLHVVAREQVRAEAGRRVRRDRAGLALADVHPEVVIRHRPTRRVGEGVVVARLVAHVVEVVERVGVEQLIALAELRHRGEQRLGERAGPVVQLVGADQLVVQLDLDAPQQVGGDLLEPVLGVDLDIAAARLTPVTVPEEGDRVAALGFSVPGVGDPLRVERTALDSGVRDPAVVDPDVVVAQQVVVPVAHLAHRPHRDVADGVGERGVLRPAVHSAQALLVSDLPPVVRRLVAVPDDPLEPALDAGVEHLLRSTRLEFAAVCHRGELLSVQHVRLGFLGAVVARHAPPGVHRDRRRAHVPANAGPAVASR